MKTTGILHEASRLHTDPATGEAPGEARRIAVRQAGLRLRQAERRLGDEICRLRELAPDGPDYAPAVAEVHRCERALFSRRLELREACEEVRRHQPCLSTLDPEGRTPAPKARARRDDPDPAGFVRGA